MRSIDHPLIGTQGRHREFIEYDAGGEYFRKQSLIYAFTDTLERQMNYANEKGASGISVRVERYGASNFNHPNAINYWYLGLRASGQAATQDEVWRRFTVEMFGERAASTMEKVLRPTGEVVAEALCIGRDTFVNGRANAVAGLSGSLRNLDKPLDYPWTPWHAVADPDSPLKKAYDQAMAGDPAVIASEKKAYADQLASADESLRLLETVRDDLTTESYTLVRWLLAENKYHLVVMQEAQLAWLKTQRMKSASDADEKAQLAGEVKGHLAHITAQLPALGEKLQVVWRGKKYSFTRGGNFNPEAFLKHFHLWFQSALSHEPTTR